MRILLIGNYVPDRQESMQRFARLMQRELTARGHSVELLHPPAILGNLMPGTGAGKWLGYVDKFLLFPLKLRSRKRHCDLVHVCDHSNALYVRHIADTPHLVTCHDVLAIKSALGEVPENRVSATGRVFQRMILNGLKAARYIVCDSQATRADLLRFTGRAPDSSEVTYLSMNYPYSPMPRGQALDRLGQCGFDASSPYFIHVGGAQWYKNRLGVLQIFAELCKLALPNLRLLMVGKPLSASLRAHIEENGLAGAVVSLSGLSNEDLRAAYSLAEGLIFPSLQEGFGWPVLEAQACGCPVFTSGRPPMTEVGGDAAIYFNPADVTDAARVIASQLGARQELRRRALNNVSRFSVDQLMHGYDSAYRKVLSRCEHSTAATPSKCAR